MTDWNATIELSRRLSDDEVDTTIDALSGFGVSVSESARRRTQLTITLQAETIQQASTTGLALAGESAPDDAQPISSQVMTTAEFDASAGIISLPSDLLSVTEAADALGVSRQAILKRIDSGSLPAARIGRAWGIPAAVIDRAG